MSEPAWTDRRAELLAVVEAAQRAAGVLAARERGDSAGAAELMASFEDDQTLAGGSLLLAELSLGLYRQETGQSMDECVRELCLQMESAVRSA